MFQISTFLSHSILHGRKSGILLRSLWLLQSNAHRARLDRADCIRLWGGQCNNRSTDVRFALRFTIDPIRFRFDRLFSSDICQSFGQNTQMCPRCDKTCPFWKLSDSCLYSRVSDREIGFSHPSLHVDDCRSPTYLTTQPR